MRTAFFVLLTILIATPAQAKWVRIGNGPSLDYAQAYCDNAAMGMPQPGYFVMGSQSYVAGAQIGYGIGGLIRQARFKSNCMIMQGWKNVSEPGKGGNWNGAPRQK